MNAKIWFNSKSYWLKGGLMSMFLIGIIFIVLLFIGDRLTISDYFTFPAWFIILAPGSILVGLNNVGIFDFIMAIMLSFIFYFIIGAIFGYIYESLKNKLIRKN